MGTKLLPRQPAVKPAWALGASFWATLFSPSPPQLVEERVGERRFPGGSPLPAGAGRGNVNLRFQINMQKGDMRARAVVAFFQSGSSCNLITGAVLFSFVK